MADLIRRATFLDEYDVACEDISRRQVPWEEHLHRLSQAVKFTPYDAARVSYLLRNGLFGDEPPAFPAYVVDVLAEFIAELVLPACWGDEYENVHMRTAGKMVLEAFANHSELTGTAIATVLKGYLRVSYSHPQLEGNRTLLQDDVLKEVLALFRSPACPVPVLGSFWRTVVYREPRVAFEMHGALLTSPAAPVEVVARAHEWMQSLLPRRAGLEMAGNLGRMDEHYPELASLPLHMKLGVIATQPVPAEWFEQGLPEPEWVVELVPTF